MKYQFDSKEKIEMCGLCPCYSTDIYQNAHCNATDDYPEDYNRIGSFRIIGKHGKVCMKKPDWCPLKEVKE